MTAVIVTDCMVCMSMVCMPVIAAVGGRITMMSVACDHEKQRHDYRKWCEEARASILVKEDQPHDVNYKADDRNLKK